MALGVWHDRVNLTVGSLLTGSMLGFEMETKKVVCFSLGWLFSTLIFGPDSDIIPKKRSQWLRFVLRPYSFLSTHRGLSHHFLWGTILRNVYLMLIFYLIGFIISLAHKVLHGHISSALFSLLEFEMLIWFLAGQWLSDLLHLLTDRVYDKLFGRY